MESITRENYWDTVGVIIARLQCDELHEGHKFLFDSVLSNHSSTILFLGTSVTTAGGSRRNPLDFITRKLMVEKEYSNKIKAILPLNDNRSDYKWSEELDKKIKEVFPNKKVLLYGSTKDSFAPYYHGEFNIKLLPAIGDISATTFRDKIGTTPLSTEDFRRGIIYKTHNTYPMVYSCVDIAIINDNKEILLARKESDPEGQYRFVGGFVDVTDASDFAACRREAFEETGLEVEPFEYVTSGQVDDWRYQREVNKIMTRLYIAKRISGLAKASDDIFEVKWLPSASLFNHELIVPEHRFFIAPLLNKINQLEAIASLQK